MLNFVCIVFYVYNTRIASIHLVQFVLPQSFLMATVNALPFKGPINEEFRREYFVSMPEVSQFQPS